MTKNNRFDEHGRKIPSVHSPKYVGSRKPEGAPGLHRPRITGDALARLTDYRYDDRHGLMVNGRGRVVARPAEPTDTYIPDPGYDSE